MLALDSKYIHEDAILSGIYDRAVRKFLSRAEGSICFRDAADYIMRLLAQKKQDTYGHSLMILKEVCQAIGEDFYAGIEFFAPMAKSYQDAYFEIFE